MTEASQPQSGSGWYKRVFAWIMAHGATEYERAVSERKQALFANVHGDVLEIGPGTVLST